MLDRLRYIDRRLILSGILAFLAATLLLLLSVAGPPESRFGSALGLIGLLVGIQAFLLFFRPPDRSPFGRAREAFLAIDYDSAAAQLEALIAVRPTPRALTLLGNTYRQQGHLDTARLTIRKALDLRANDAYALYGLGRIDLAEGRFEAAADSFDQALGAGAPANVACDLGYAEYFQGNHDAALKTLQKTTRILRLESYRLFLTNAILYRLIRDKSGTAAKTTLSNIEQSREGLPYWEAEIARFPGSAYASALQDILAGVDASIIKSGA